MVGEVIRLCLAGALRAHDGYVRRTRRSMGWAVPLARIAGIRIYVHLTFLLLVGLIAYSESRPGGLGAWGGVVWVMAIFGCVLVHELAHSILARRLGASVKAIVLLPIGGVSQIQDMPRYWADEFWIAAVGPLASFVLGIVAIGASFAAGVALLPVNLGGGPLLPRLAWANLLLGAFNLLPAFPLDGGRVLRAWLERSHDAVTATRIAAQLGRTLAVAMIVFGFFWNLWFLLIGVFVYLGAAQEERIAVVHSRLTGWSVLRLMRHPVTTIEAETPVEQLRECWPGPQVITADGRYVGLALGSDLAEAPGGSTAGEVADREAPALAPGEDVGASALDTLINSGYPALAVVEDDRPVGVLAIADIAAWQQSQGTSRTS